ncbi:MAG: hypothetical protein GY828_01930 [Candidatus Gracilibacteria bacterium]|nr:hypothetical protein [Candidatus Gracilibacteria bacterium]
MKNINDINTKNQDPNIILQNYLQDIYDINDWKGKEIYKIQELTYSYRFSDVLEKKDQEGTLEYGDITSEVFFNETLFESIGGLTYDSWYLLPKDDQIQALKNVGEKITHTLEKKIAVINEATSRVNTLEFIENPRENTKTNQLKKKIFEGKKYLFLGAIQESKLSLEQGITSLPFELEKAGLTLIDFDKEFAIEKLNRGEEKLFGGKISKDNNEEEIGRTYQYLRTKYDNFDVSKREDFTEDDEKKILSSMETIAKLIPNYKYSAFTEAKKVTEKSLNSQVEINDYLKAFNYFAAASGYDYEAKIDNSVGSITDAEEGLLIPDTHKTKHLSLEMVIRMIAHEFVAHTSNLLNGNLILGFRGAGNMEKEEGIAMLWESKFLYGENFYTQDKNGKTIINKDKINISSYHHKTLVAELVSGEDFFNFLKSYEKIEPDYTTTTLLRFLRLKRGRPLDLPGSQTKDTTYIRGQFTGVDMINQGIDINDLSLAKVAYEDIGLVKEILENLTELCERPSLVTFNLHYEYIYFKLLQKRVPEIYKSIKYIDYLSKKYPMEIFNLSDLVIFETEITLEKGKNKISNIIDILDKSVL